MISFSCEELTIACFRKRLELFMDIFLVAWMLLFEGLISRNCPSCADTNYIYSAMDFRHDDKQYNKRNSREEYHSPFSLRFGTSN